MPPPTTTTKPSSKSSASSKDSSQLSTHKLALKGSSKAIVEFFDFACNTILFQRGVYPPEDFVTVKKYGLPMMTSCDDQVKAYIKKIMHQLSRWMQKSKISKLVIVVTSKETGEHVERWQFDVNVFSDPSKPSSSSASSSGPTDKENSAPSRAQEPEPPQQQQQHSTEDARKSDDDIHKEIQALFRQITSSVTFLPMLDGHCTFNVLVYADADSEVPLEWGDSDAKEVKNAEKVMLRSFSTNNHRIDTVVSYRLAE